MDVSLEENKLAIHMQFIPMIIHAVCAFGLESGVFIFIPWGFLVGAI